MLSSPVHPLPRLIVAVDTEEEFDWHRSFSRAATQVTHVRHLERVQRMLQSFGVRPVYLVDYAVASQEAGWGPLREWFRNDLCDIGAHLHPWVNPPFDEEVSAVNSYPGNLPPSLEREKLARLTEAIGQAFGRLPEVYRAGRYGIGPHTAATLETLGYGIDSSVVPFTSFAADGGPDFRLCSPDVRWIGEPGRVLEVPLTVGWCGALRRWGPRVRGLFTSKLLPRLHVPGVLARLGWLERIRLTPEGVSFPELRRLTDTLLSAGVRTFVLSFHSPTVVPGNTPYVRTEAELAAFLETLESYCRYFRDQCGGMGGTFQEVRRVFLSAGEGVAAPSAPNSLGRARAAAAAR